jgi:UDP-N-acetylmuramate--alanine ligase
MKINQHIVFVGIGGIGMSALARFFLAKGHLVYGYDRSHSPLVEQLVQEGAVFTAVEDLTTLPTEEFRVESTTVVITPAIPEDNLWLTYFKRHGFVLYKRAAILGEITKNSNNLSVAGTHGKTTTSSILAHLMHESGFPMVGFVGGILKNYDSNYVTNSKNNQDNLYSITEADEYDRSFLQLSPNHAVVTSVDADHLDIYGKADSVVQSFVEFANRVPKEGKLLVHHKIASEFRNCLAESITYGIGIGQIRAEHVHVHKGNQIFDVYLNEDVWRNMIFQLPGHHNLENALAALGMAHLVLGLGEKEIRKSLSTYQGVQRRFDRTEKLGRVYIDDYAHHPAELAAAIQAARQFYPNKKITGVFQPHLFTRTRDFMDGFAEVLSTLDEVVLMEIYPAREQPIPGITAQTLLDLITHKHKKIMAPEEVLEYAKKERPEVLMTLGAGDIDKLVSPLKEAYGQS